MQPPNMCRYWTNGKCKRGNQCKWLHAQSNTQANRFSYLSTSPITNSPINYWKPKTPVNTFQVKKEEKVEERQVVINGKWADVQDTDSFFE